MENDRCVDLKISSLKTADPWTPHQSSPPQPGNFHVKLQADHTYPLEELYDVSLFLALPRSLTFITQSAWINGQEAESFASQGFVIVSTEKIKGKELANIEFDVAISDTTKWPIINYLLLVKTENGKTLTPLSCGANEYVREKALMLYLPDATDGKKGLEPYIDKSPVAAFDAPVRYGFRFPETETLITSADLTRIEIAVPNGDDYSLTLNELPLTSDKIGETSTDAKNNVKNLTYLAVELQSGENILELRLGDTLIDRRTITVTGEVKQLTHNFYPARPEADGKTPAYIVVHLRDSQGELIKENAYLKVFTDRGEIFDVEEDRYTALPDDGFTVQAIAGKATFKLSPASTTQRRRIVVMQEDLELRFDVRFFPEKRPWIIAGGIEGTFRHSDTKNSDDALVDYPADHSDDGTHFDTEAGIFAKGQMGEFTVTAMYDSDRDIDDGTLLEQNIPSTEEGEFYPVYGDESEQYFETQSQDNLYVKIERDLSYFLHGDYQTDFAHDLEYNVYRRTLHGQQINVEFEDNFRVNAIFSENSQDIIREEQPGRGISGPYFFREGIPIEFSERIFIETRDRNRPELIISHEEKRRFTDYTINYNEGWILFNDPVHEFDDAFNPIVVIMIYESERDGRDEPIWGIRGEKHLGENLTLGGMYVLEEHMIEDKSIAGVDLIYDDGDTFKFVAEYAKTDGFEANTLTSTKGDAIRLELNTDHTDIHTRAWYVDVDDGFQNPSATNVLSARKTYGIEIDYDFFTNSTVTAEAYHEDSEARETKVAGLQAIHRLKWIELTGGLRWKKEIVTGDKVDDIQAISGIKITPVDKLTLNLRHEQGFGDGDTDNFPDRTVFGASYRFTQTTAFNVQHEIRQQREKDVALTTFGIDSQIEILPNTTGFMKYSIDDSISGFRSQSHLGLNHNWLVRDDFTLDFGGENVESLDGDGDDKGDHIALHGGFQYLPRDEKYRLSGRYETRFGEVDTEHVVTLGGTVKLRQNTTFLVRERFFESQQSENDLLFGVAYRPVANDRWNHLMKFRHKWKNFDDLETTKYIGSWHVNYQLNEDLTLMSEYAFKYEEPEDSISAFTDLIRGRVLWDITKRIDCNAHAGIMRQTTSDTYTLAWGPEVGYKVFQNLWLSAGYNFSGFSDDDFDDSEFWNKGPYLKFRFKFDESILEIFNRPDPDEVEDKFEPHLIYDDDGITAQKQKKEFRLPSFRSLLGVD